MITKSLGAIEKCNWFQTYPGVTSGRVWVIQDPDGHYSKKDVIAELDLDTMSIINTFETPQETSSVLPLATGPNSLFMCGYRVVTWGSPSTIQSLFYELDPENGQVLDEGILAIPYEEGVVQITWHKGMIYAISIVIQPRPLPGEISPLPATFLNKFDAKTKALVSRIPLPNMHADGLIADPYTDTLVLYNLHNFVTEGDLFTLTDINPETDDVIKQIHQPFVGTHSMAFTNGMLYQTTWSKDELQELTRFDGAHLNSHPLTNVQDIGGLTGGIGIKGGHRIWIGQGNVTANFGNRLNNGGTISGTKYEDLNGNGFQNSDEPGLADWTIYIDENNNFQLDITEPSTITDSNGHWAFTNLGYGIQNVREVQQPGYRSIAPVANWHKKISVNDARDVVFDNLRHLLYISTASGVIKQYDLTSEQFLSDITVGGDPHGIDISLDHSHLYVCNTELKSGSGVVHKINLATLSVTDLNYSVESNEDGSYDIAIDANGLALITSIRNSTNFNLRLRILDTNNDIISLYPDILGNTYIGDKCRLISAADRKTIWLVENTLSGDIFVYDAVTSTFTRQAALGSNLSYAPIALNRNGTKGAIQLSDAPVIVDADFNTIMRLYDFTAGAQFAPDNDFFYQFQNIYSQLYVIDTKTWHNIAKEKSGTTDQDDPDNQYIPFAIGETAAAKNGHVVCITQNDYIMLHYNAYRLRSIPGWTFANNDFGNKIEAAEGENCGDIDLDGDVDTTDLLYFSQDWLKETLQFDLQPISGDGIVALPDYGIFANAWLSQVGDENWDPRCDVAPNNGNGIVDTQDLLVLSDQWLLEGAEYTPDLIGDDNFINLLDFSCLHQSWGIIGDIISYDEDFETGDFTHLPWLKSGDGLWTIDTASPYEGTYHAISASGLSINDESSIKVTKTCEEGFIHFMFKAQEHADLYFYIDDINHWSSWERVAEDISNNDWTLATVPVTAGTHTFEWRVETNSNTDNQSSIDAIRFP